MRLQLSDRNPAQKTGFNIEYGLGLVDMPYDEVPNIRIENGEADVVRESIGGARARRSVPCTPTTQRHAWEVPVDPPGRV